MVTDEQFMNDLSDIEKHVQTRCYRHQKKVLEYNMLEERSERRRRIIRFNFISRAD